MDEIFKDLRIDEIKIDVDVCVEEVKITNRHIAPKKNMGIAERFIKIDNAIKLAKDIVLSQNERYYCILSGNFEFGDFIEAFIMVKPIKVKELTISTLSMGKNNIDSLKTLILKDKVKKLNLIVSDYYYAHNKTTAIPYIYKELDDESKENFNFAVAATHCKVALIHTECGKKIILHGSANLRSSSNIEQLVVEISDDLYDFNYTFLQMILDEYTTINKSLRDKKLWQTITQE
jgi:hypothetical protein